MTTRNLRTIFLSSSAALHKSAVHGQLALCQQHANSNIYTSLFVLPQQLLHRVCSFCSVSISGVSIGVTKKIFRYFRVGQYCRPAAVGCSKLFRYELVTAVSAYVPICSSLHRGCCGVQLCHPCPAAASLQPGAAAADPVLKLCFKCEVDHHAGSVASHSAVCVGCT